MQKIIFGIFAHPDDEAFGPCATLLSETKNGAELHLITLTAGENGMNPDNVSDLAATRLQEWRASTALLGARTTHHLGYIDGTLGNNDHIAIASEIENIVRKVTDGRHDIEVEFISFDLNGLTGHIDHIVAGRSACLVYYRLQALGLPVSRVRLACLAYTDYPAIDTGFVFMQPGRTKDEIDETVDGRDLLDEVHKVMRCHHTQRSDCEAQIAKLGDGVAVDHFMIIK
jgi:LmbE family N-acetylglucosaminyl deacetylase